MARRYDATETRTGVATNYARIIGIVVLLVGVVGLLLGDAQRLLGLFNIELIEDIIHLVTGGLMAYVGFAQRDNRLARTVVGALGIVYLLVGIIGFISPTLFGLLNLDYTLADNLLHLGLGVLGIIIGYFLPDATTATV